MTTEYANYAMTATLRAMLRGFGSRASSYHTTEGVHIVFDGRESLKKYLEGLGCEVISATHGTKETPILKVRLKPLEKKTVTVGTCRFCGRVFSVEKAGRLADHGFHISDGGGRYYGYRAGQCPGQRKTGWEKSTETGLILKAAIERTITMTNSAIEGVKSGEIKVQGRHTGWDRSSGRMKAIYEELGPGDAGWETYRDHRIENLQFELRNLEEELSRLDNDLANWKESEYPKESRTK